MEYETVKRKQNKQIQDTRPSRNWSDMSQKSQGRNVSSLLSQMKPNLDNSELTDKKIHFQNGWIYDGQHLNQKFHGWGSLISKNGRLIFKGNFQNGYFQKEGKLFYNDMFSYLICMKAIEKWVFQNQKRQNRTSDIDLKQIQIQKPLESRKNRVYSFAKSKNTHKIYSNTSSLNQSAISQKKQKLQWIKYTGDFSSGNISGFGTLKLIITGKNQQKQYKTGISITGKFIEGKIITGIIRK